MDIQATMPTPPRGLEETMPAPAQAAVARRAVSARAANAQAPAAPVIPDLPEVVQTRLQLYVDEGSGRVIGRFVNAETGEVVRQVPPEEVVRLLARAREMIGALLDKTA